ncbi:MAG: CBS domain-containing protein [Acidobacteriia bacterium]|nr:CBS domain-containing protein [Terriglobia bacterium]
MAKVKDVIKDRKTYTANADQTILEAARYMGEHNIGAMPVLREGKLVGIFSERDIMKRVVAEARDPRTTKVSDVMTKDPVTVTLETTIDECMALMAKHNCRHLPICENDKLWGLISLRDVLIHDVAEKADEARHLKAYIHSST